MKTLLSTLLICLFALSLTAQTGLNTKYLNEVKHKGSSAKILKFQNMAALYNIQETDVFKADKNSTYDVVFEETNCKIEATYSANGQIINTIESYKNMRLPYELASEVQKNYSNWEVFSNTQSLSYNNTKGLLRNFEIKIKKGNVSKVLKYKLNSQDDKTNYVALN